MKLTWRSSSLLTIHFNSTEILCNLLSLKPRLQLLASQATPLSPGILDQHVFNMPFITNIIHSFIKKHGLVRPLTAFSCQEPLISESIGAHQTLTEFAIHYAFCPEYSYIGKLLPTTQFQLQLLALQENMRCILISSKYRALQETISMVQMKKFQAVAQTMEDYREYLDQEISNLLTNSCIDLAPNLDEEIYKEISAECAGLYYLGKRVYGTL